MVSSSSSSSRPHDDGDGIATTTKTSGISYCVLTTNILLLLVAMAGFFALVAAVLMRHAAADHWFTCALFEFVSTGITLGGVFSIIVAVGLSVAATRCDIRAGGYKGCRPCCDGGRKNMTDDDGDYLVDSSSSPSSSAPTASASGPSDQTPLNSNADFDTAGSSIEGEGRGKGSVIGKTIILPCLANTCFLLWFAILMVSGVLGGLFVAWTKDLPDLEKDFTQLTGPSGPITITRDAAGITHVSAGNKLDAVFGQGFAHGQDRLWQIEFQRLAYKGLLAEHLGVAAEKFDKQTRTLNFKKAAEMLCSNLSTDENAFYQSYVNGLNAYLATNTNRPPEFLFMSTGLIGYHQPKPFELVDVCGAARLLQWKLSLNVNREIERFKIFWETDADYAVLENLYTNFTNMSSTILTAKDLNISGEDMIRQRAQEADIKAVERELYSVDGFMGRLRTEYNPDYGNAQRSAMKKQEKKKIHNMKVQATVAGPDDGPGANTLSPSSRSASVDEDSSSSCSLLSLLGIGTDEEEEEHEGDHLDIVKWIRDHASNAWVGKGDGLDAKSCQASDPHLELNSPSVWYYTHLHWVEAATPTANSSYYDVAGVGMLGIPGVHIGKSSSVSWGITMSMTDLEDLFLLVPSKENPATHYMHNEEEVAYSLRTETIHVKGKKEPIVLTVKDSFYGPVSTEALGLPRPDVLNFAIAARALQPDNTSLTAIYNMVNPEVNTAVKVRDMICANLQSPGFSIPCTDKDGQMVYTMTGSHVIRAFGHTGWLPTIGNGTFDWVGSIPFPELPTKVIPAGSARGAISAANQKTYPDGYKYILGLDFVYPYRGKRLQQLVNTSIVNTTDQSASDPSSSSSPLSDLEYHVKVQTDIRSNMWAQLFRPLLNSSDGAVGHPDDGQELPVAMPFAFETHLNSKGKVWLQRLMAWDGRSTKGTVQPTFFWFWYRTLGRYPAPVLNALNHHLWTNHQYPYRSLSAPSALTESDCLNFYLENEAESPSMPSDRSNPCFWLAIDSFNTMAAEYADPSTVPKWGVDVNRINALNQMMSKTPLKCMFDLKAGKDGDHTSIDVADPSTLHGKIPIIAASSMRQVYSWATPTWIHFALPGGESGNPFSPRYSNLLGPYIADLYENVTVEGMANIQNTTEQVLSP